MKQRVRRLADAVPYLNRLLRTVLPSAVIVGGEKDLNYYTVLIELFWSKERIIEIYLNIAETGKGVFGVEAAAQKYFGCHAAKLNTHQAVSIACVLPNPLGRNPKTISQQNQSKYHITYKRTQVIPYPFGE